MDLAMSPSFILESVKSWKSRLRGVGIENHQLLDKSRVSLKVNNFDVPYFPLEWFVESDEQIQWSCNAALPTRMAIAFLPNPQDSAHDKLGVNELYDWFAVTLIARDNNNDRDHWTLETYAKKRVTRRTYKNIHDIFVVNVDENPDGALARIKFALHQRQQLELSFKMTLLLECMNLSGLPLPSEKMQDRIWRMAAGRTDGKQQRTRLMEQMKMDYLSVVAMLDMQRYYQNDDLFDSLRFSAPLHLCTLHYISDMLLIRERQPIEFRSNERAFKLNTLFNHSEIVHAMHALLMENEALAKLSLFTLSRSGRETLFDFEKAQSTSSALAVNHLRGIWATNWTEIVRLAMIQCGDGDFDAKSDDWSLFRRTKGYRLLRNFRCRMETTIRQLVADSALSYTNFLCNPCAVCSIMTDRSSKWGNDLINSQFIPADGEDQYIFQITLEINKHGAYYLTDPREFGTVVTHLLDDAIKQSHFIEIIDPNIMSNLVYPQNQYLSSLGLQSPIVIDCRQRLRDSFDAAVIPLKAYAEEFQQFVEPQILDVDEYMVKVAQITSSQELKVEIQQAMQWRDRLQSTVPTYIVIGPFKVLLGDMKKRLVDKYELLTQRLLDHLAKKLTNEMQSIVDQFTEAMDRLRRRPHMIEDIAKTRDWMENELPVMMAKLEQAVKMKMYEFEILDGFLYALDDAQADVKWSAVIFSYRLRGQYEPTLATFELCQEQFAKQQTADVIAFEEQCEVLNGAVFTLSNHSDVDHAAEYAVEVQRIWHSIEDAHRQAALMNRRQMLFQRSTIDAGPLQCLQDTFMPFRRFWTTAGDFLKLRDTSFGNPLSVIDLDHLHGSIARLREQLIGCADAFVELRSVDAARLHFLKQLDEFESIVAVMDDVKNPDWLTVHWQTLCRTAGIEIRPNATLTFDTCITNGILDHRDLVHSLSSMATEQRAAFEAERKREEEAKLEAEEARLRFKRNRRGRKLE